MKRSVILQTLWSIRLAPVVSFKEHGGHDAIDLQPYAGGAHQALAGRPPLP